MRCQEGNWNSEVPLRAEGLDFSQNRSGRHNEHLGGVRRILRRRMPQRWFDRNRPAAAGLIPVLRLGEEMGALSSPTNMCRLLDRPSVPVDASWFLRSFTFGRARRLDVGPTGTPFMGDIPPLCAAR